MDTEGYEKTQAIMGRLPASWFVPQSIVKGLFGDPQALVIKLCRRGKKRFVEYAGKFTAAIMTIR